MIDAFFIISDTGEVLVERRWAGSSARKMCEIYWKEISKYTSSSDVPPVLSIFPHYIISLSYNKLSFLIIIKNDKNPLVLLELLKKILNNFLLIFNNNFNIKIIKKNYFFIYNLIEEIFFLGNPYILENNLLKDIIKEGEKEASTESLMPSNWNNDDNIFNNLISSATSAALSTTSSSSSSSFSSSPIVLSNIPWRTLNPPNYHPNEIYFDIIENFNLLINNKNKIIKNSIEGRIICNSKLSGHPELLLNLNKKLENFVLHSCIRLKKFLNENILSFIPPDGEFELLKYFLSSDTSISSLTSTSSSASAFPSEYISPIYCHPLLSFDQKKLTASITIMIGINPSNSLISSTEISSSSSSSSFSSHVASSSAFKKNLTLEDVEIILPFTKNVKTTNLQVTTGEIFYYEEKKSAVWKIKKISANTPGNSIKLTGTIYLNSFDSMNSMATLSASTTTTSLSDNIDNLNEVTSSSSSSSFAASTSSSSAASASLSSLVLTSNFYNEANVLPQIELDWKVTAASFSGLTISSLQVLNPKFKPYKGVRTMVQAGKHYIRTTS